MNLRNASIIDGEMTLWVIFDRSSDFCASDHVRFAPKTDMRSNRIEIGRYELADYRGQHLADAAAEAAPRAAVNDATVNAQAVPHFKAFLDKLEAAIIS
ncbi:MAG TPA: hypothetical protein VGZ24_00180 [Chthoniobacterales bacterium]|jgi:hypothetical protein|nr:hypothetical protein [Chthoniobacterales bacterium]